MWSCNTAKLTAVVFAAVCSVLSAEPSGSGILTKLAEVETGRGPKSLLFVPDGTRLVAALLFGNGVEVYSVDPLRQLQKVILDKEEAGFVEMAYSETRQEVWVTQMLTNSVHILDAKTFERKITLKTSAYRYSSLRPTSTTIPSFCI